MVDILDDVVDAADLLTGLERLLTGFCRPESPDSFDRGRLSFDPIGCDPKDLLVGASKTRSYNPPLVRNRITFLLICRVLEEAIAEMKH